MKTAIHFRGTVRTHRGIESISLNDLQIYERETAAIYGLSEEQMDLLVSLITGTQQPDEGRITIFGTDTRSLREHNWFEFVKGVGLFQARPILEEDASIGENVAGLIRVHEEFVAEPQLSAAVLDLATLVHLSVAELAKMMRQATILQRAKVRLARALAGRPRLVILCSPTADLLPDVSAQFADLIRRVCRKTRITLLLLSSDVQLLERVADRVIFPDLHSGITMENRLRGRLHKLFPFLKPRPAQLYQLSHRILSRL